MSAITFGWRPNPHDGRMKRRAELHVVVPEGYAVVYLLGKDGKAMQKKTVAISEDGTRCRFGHEGGFVDATREGAVGVPPTPGDER